MTIPLGVTVNGTAYEFPEQLTVAQLLQRLELPERGVAVAVNGALFPKTQWSQPVEGGWKIDVLTAVQGG